MRCASRMQGYIFPLFFLFLGLVCTFFFFSFLGGSKVGILVTHWGTTIINEHNLGLFAVLVVILMSNHFLMHYLTCVYKICFVKCEKLFKFVFIEARLASMMRAPSPRALRLVLWELMRLSVPRTFKTKVYICVCVYMCVCV